MSERHPQVQCPVCGTPVTWSQAAPYRPFCSERCRLIDLGDWLSESQRIPGEPAPHVPGDEEPDDT